MDISAATWNTLSKLMDEALDLEPVVRTTWLDALAASRPDLAPSLRKLLAAHASSETADVLKRLPTLAAGRAVAEAMHGLATGDRVGPYRLKRELGSGGMADVWLAERADGAFTREVALKLPRISRLRRDLAARFARERDILARLEHPNVARLYDAGVATDGLPYLAMEYVDGTPITAYCDARRLDIGARLKLFGQVLEAVQYAHANLVIHRDLKPSNILVTADGQVRLLDFGIAKLLVDEDAAHETQLTQFAGRALTPDYASPEQIKGEPLTIASDVYSLGVVLYELLAGNRPYRLKVSTAAHLEQAILEAESPPPSSHVAEHAAAARAATARHLARVLAGDLDTIAMKALAKAPTLRYPTIAAFAEDLQRHRDGRPVQARPASAWHRARRFAVRNKLAVGAASGIAAALLIGAGLTLWQAREAQRQSARATAVKDFLVGLFEANSLEPQDSVRRRRMSAGQLLAEAAHRIGDQLSDEPALKADLQAVLGRLLHDLSMTDQALAVRQQRLEAVTQANASLAERALAMREFADTLAQKGEIGPARSQLQAAVALLEPSRGTADTVLRWSLVSTLGYMNVESGDRALGAAQVGQAEQSLRALAPQSIEYAEALLLQAEVHSMANRTELSVPMFTEATDLLQRHLGPRSIRLARHRFRIAQAFASQRRDTQAEQQFRLALKTMTETAGPSHPATAVVQLSLGRTLSVRGLTAEGRALIEPAAAVLLARPDDVDPIHAANAQVFLGEALLDEGRIGAAGAPLRLALQRYEGTGSFAQLAVAQAIYARYLLDSGRFEEAMRVLDKVRAARAAAFGHDHPAVAAMTNRIGLVHLAAGRYDIAERTFRAVGESQANREDRFGSPRHLAALNLATLAIEQGRYHAALPAIEDYAQRFEQLPAGERNAAAEFAVRVRMARALIGVGRAEEARTHVVRAQLLAAPLYEHSPGRIQVRLLAARLLAAQGDLTRARTEVDLARLSLRAQPELGPQFARAIRSAEADVERVR